MCSGALLQNTCTDLHCVLQLTIFPACKRKLEQFLFLQHIRNFCNLFCMRKKLATVRQLKGQKQFVNVSYIRERNFCKYKNKKCFIQSTPDWLYFSFPKKLFLMKSTYKNWFWRRHILAKMYRERKKYKN